MQPESKKKYTVGLLSNPLSGWNQKGMRFVREAVNGHPQICHQEASEPSEIALALAEFSYKKIGIIAVNGGDGTIHAVLTELFRQSDGGPIPLLTILRSGTASMIARDVGLNGSPERSLKRLVKWIDRGRANTAIVKRPILKVETASGREPFYGMFFGTAGICQGIEFCLTRVHTKGLGGELAAGVTLARSLLSIAGGKSSFLFPVPTSIALNTGSIEKRDVLSIIISTLERLFLGLRPYWGDEKNAPLHYTEMGAHPRGMLRVLPFLLRGRKNRFLSPEHGYLSRNIQKARLEFSGSFSLDGELYTSDAGHQRLTVSKGGTASFLKL